jgi:hypothetical protein
MAKCKWCGNDIEDGRGHAWDCTSIEGRAEASRIHRTDVTNEVPIAEGASNSKPSIKRYLDLYRVARLLIALGTTVKGVGVVLAIIIFLFWLVVGFIASSQTQPSSPFGPSRANAATIQIGSLFAFIVLGLVSAALVGGLFFLLGVLISAQGQLLLAQADSAVHTSPFLTDKEKATVMSLPY